MRKNEKGHFIYVKSFRNHKTGQIIHASSYGKKAFRIWIKD